MTEEDVEATNHRYAADEADSEARSAPGALAGPRGRPYAPKAAYAAVWALGAAARCCTSCQRSLTGRRSATSRHLALWQAVEKAGPRGITVDDLAALDLPQFAARSCVNGPLMQWRKKG
ncbi:hypothetical protein OG894_44930 (plasmid) [Streptomyces sp. NBC_01724]|uniref:hypothetical protein n=1 Tax=Streptomyces sp. NBC_01724 TaxID=2975922 RepID=UPI002E340825|nr:hypothetical protein [Streptomyces sp. NBC_01724]